MQKAKLDHDEQDILDSFERGEWKPVANRRQEIARHVAYARNTLTKNRRVNIFFIMPMELVEPISLEGHLDASLAYYKRILVGFNRLSFLERCPSG